MYPCESFPFSYIFKVHIKGLKEICHYTNCNNMMLLNYVSVAIGLDKPLFC